MEYTIRPVQYNDGPAVTALFNHYVMHSWASYLDSEVGPEFFESLWANVPDYPFFVAESEGSLIGYGLAKPYCTLAKKRRTAEVSYFIHPDHLGRGLGRQLLDRVTSHARDHGFQVLIASIMGLNEASVRFHEKMGFTHAGRMHQVIKKWGEIVDMIWMEKFIGKPGLKKP